MTEPHKYKILRFYRDHNRMPSMRELADICEFKSVNAAFKLSNKLMTEGVLNKDSKGRLIPRSLGLIRRLGRVEAGWPSPAEEELCDTLSLDDYLIDNPEASYLLTVSGDSMIDAGIKDGDSVIVERTNAAKPGDIVIAEVDGEWTMKYLRRRGSHYYLEPANKAFKPIVPKQGLKVVAVVKAVFRKYS